MQAYLRMQAEKKSLSLLAFRALCLLPVQLERSIGPARPAPTLLQLHVAWLSWHLPIPCQQNMLQQSAVNTWLIDIGDAPYIGVSS